MLAAGRCRTQAEQPLADRRAARGQFTGYFAELDAMRNAVRAWAAVRGYEVVDRPYEAYTGGIGPAFTENGSFEIYWPIK